MLPDMNADGVYIRAGDRRKRARRMALRILEEGVSLEDLTLRMVAERSQIPLSTLTHAYPNRTSLLRDMVVDFFTAFDDDSFASIGTSGMRHELRVGTEYFVERVLKSNAFREVLRYSFMEMAAGQSPVEGRDREAALTKLFDIVAERSGEEYAVPHRTLGVVSQAMINGMLMSFFIHKDPDRYLSESLMGFEVISRAALTSHAATSDLPDRGE